MNTAAAVESLDENGQGRPGARATLPTCGISCASCAPRIEAALGKADGVSEAVVNFASENATISYDPIRVDLDHFVSTIERAGYGAEPVPPMALSSVSVVTNASLVRRWRASR